MFLGQDGFVWWIGVVEDTSDPLLMGRARVRIFGYHAPYTTSEDTLTSTGPAASELPWAIAVMPTNIPDAYGKPRLGDWVLGFFLDGKEAQEPAILGYIPGFASDQRFGKYNTTKKNFSHVYRNNFLFPTANSEFYDISNRFSFETDSGHKLLMSDGANTINSLGVVRQEGNVRKVQLMHSSNAAYTMTSNGTETSVKISHPKGSYIEFKDDGTIEVAAHWPGEVKNIQIGQPPPSGGGDCFTKNTKVIMADGSVKRIYEIEVGDFVMDRTHSRANRVMFIEKVVDTTWESLYSPNEMYEPFITINHPIYYGGKLSSPNNKNVENLYPWLGKIEYLSNCTIVPTTGEIVYNLWVDGDGTYIVNGYGTTSIMMDGGLLRIAHERGYLSHEEVMDLVLEFTTDGSNLQYGAYVINGVVGKLNFDWLFRFFAWISRKKKSNILRKSVVELMRMTSLVAKLIYRR